MNMIFIRMYYIFMMPNNILKCVLFRKFIFFADVIQNKVPIQLNFFPVKQKFECVFRKLFLECVIVF